MKVTKLKDNDYLYATGRCRALEKYMLTDRDVSRMIDASDAEEAFKIADDISLHSSLNAAEYEKAVNNMFNETCALAAELSFDCSLITSFLYKYDVHNLKVLIKSRFLNIKPDRLMLPFGNFSAEELQKSFLENKFPENFPYQLEEAALNASEMLTKTHDPQQIDLILDKAVYELLFEEVSKFNSGFISDYFKAMADTENLRTAVRFKRMGKTADNFREVIISGGELTAGELVNAFEADGFVQLKQIASSKYGDKLAVLFEKLDINSPLTDFERGIDNYMIEKLKEIKRIPYGIEVIFGYLLAKENEARIIRIIVASKLSGTDKENISLRVRETYA